jgi:hypothetical protein
MQSAMNSSDKLQKYVKRHFNRKRCDEQKDLREVLEERIELQRCAVTAVSVELKRVEEEYNALGENSGAPPDHFSASLRESRKSIIESTRSCLESHQRMLSTDSCWLEAVEEEIKGIFFLSILQPAEDQSFMSLFVHQNWRRSLPGRM